MTTEMSQEAVADAAADDEKTVPAWAREQIDSAKAKTATLNEKMERLAFREIGVDPGSGKAKAIKLSYDGELDPEDMGPVVEHAKEELDMELTLRGDPADATTANPEISDGEARLQKLSGGSVPIEPDAHEDAQAQAEADGDVLGALAAGISGMIEDGTLNIDPD